MTFIVILLFIMCLAACRISWKHFVAAADQSAVVQDLVNRGFREEDYSYGIPQGSAEAAEMEKLTEEEKTDRLKDRHRYRLEQEVSAMRDVFAFGVYYACVVLLSIILILYIKNII